jgi:hypothetical protein
LNASQKVDDATVAMQNGITKLGSMIINEIE